MKAPHCFPFVICMALAFSRQGTAGELLINWDAGNGLSTGPGVIGAAGDSWNQSTWVSWPPWHPISSYEVSPIVDSSGATVAGAALSLALIGSPPFNPEPGNLAGVPNGTGPTSNPAPFDFSLSNVSGFVLALTVSGLPEAAYDVFVFWGYDPNVSSTATVNGRASQSFTYAAPTAIPVVGRDYLLFTDVQPIGGAITISSPTVDTNAGMAGFQIEKRPTDGIIMFFR